MKRIVLLTAIALMLPAFAAAEDWSGVAIVDVQCSAKAKANPDAHTRDCALMCAKSGFGIVDQNGNFLKFDAKGNQEATKLLQSSSKKDHLRVNVTGTKSGDTIQVQSLSVS
ncbi:hypothetical protein [Occallatibacter riparius]|uniref:DUF2147 domain-containing protein n=1 Tax=Occallatibacter riparius TaxID=1002689 RepID=A0A9J7BPZ9_9BACT|nr:hypothetical protein [Occallatibacter riparius]UWZ84956.1 hypothetical protein MOP44_03210 [Occallatibacter riparius]